MKKLTGILAIVSMSLGFGVSATTSPQLDTSLDNFINNYQQRDALSVYATGNIVHSANCDNYVTPVEGYELANTAMQVCYDGTQQQGGVAYVEHVGFNPYGEPGNQEQGYLIHLKDQLSDVNISAFESADLSIPSPHFKNGGVYVNNTTGKSVVFLKVQDSYNGDHSGEGTFSISGIVQGVDAVAVTADLKAAIVNASKDGLQGEMRELGYFAGSGAQAISLLVDDKTQQAVADYALKTELPDVSSFAKVTDLPDLTGYAFITQLPDLSGYAKSSEIPSLIGYALKSELPDLSPYALKTEIPSTAGLATTAYVSTIKDLAANADSKATTAGNTANEALTAVQAIDLQTVLNRLQALEDENEVLKAKKSPFEQVFHVQETSPTGQKIIGKVSANTWTVRHFNYVAQNDIGGVLNSDYTFTIPAGTYYVDLALIGNEVKGFYGNLIDTDGVVYLTTGSSYSSAKSIAYTSMANGSVRFTINEPKTMKVGIKSTHSNLGSWTYTAFGIPAKRPGREVYSQIKFYKIK